MQILLCIRCNRTRERDATSYFSIQFTFHIAIRAISVTFSLLLFETTRATFVVSKTFSRGNKYNVENKWSKIIFTHTHAEQNILISHRNIRSDDYL